jgi:hypothetical protein
MKNWWIKNWKMLLPFLLIFVIGLSALATAFIFHLRDDNRGASGGLRVFYYNPAEGRLQPVAVTIPVGTFREQIDAMISRFYDPPAPWEGLWPKGLGLIDTMHYGDLVGLALPPEYRELQPSEEALFRTALSLTLMELPFVERVLIWVAGEEFPPHTFPEWVRLWIYDEEEAGAWIVETPQTVVNNPRISPGLMRTRTITLYFVCADGESLVKETFVDEYIDVHRLAEIKLQYLIAGPSGENAMHVIPPETRVRLVNIDRGTFSMYVDLSGDFASRFIGSPAIARLMLQSIVNTLTLIGNNEITVRQVFFLIDSDRYDVFHGVSGFNLAFEYDHDITLVEYEEDPEDPTGDNGEEDVTVGPRGDDEE